MVPGVPMTEENKMRLNDSDERGQETQKQLDTITIRFDDFDKRFQTLEKRFDDVKWVAGAISALLALVISAFTVAASLNITSEREALLKFEDHIREDLGRTESLPDIELLDSNQQPLEGKTIAGSVGLNAEGKKQLTFGFDIRNKGASSSGQMWIKVYTNDPVQLASKSHDEQFRWVDTSYPTDVTPNDIPGGNFSFPYDWSWVIKQDVPKGKRYPILVKIYFGKGKVAQAHFFVEVK